MPVAPMNPAITGCGRNRIARPNRNTPSASRSTAVTSVASPIAARAVASTTEGGWPTNIGAIAARPTASSTEIAETGAPIATRKLLIAAVAMAAIAEPTSRMLTPSPRKGRQGPLKISAAKVRQLPIVTRAAISPASASRKSPAAPCRPPRDGWTRAVPAASPTAASWAEASAFSSSGAPRLASQPPCFGELPARQRRGADHNVARAPQQRHADRKMRRHPEQLADDDVGDLLHPEPGRHQERYRECGRQERLDRHTGQQPDLAAKQPITEPHCRPAAEPAEEMQPRRRADAARGAENELELVLHRVGLFLRAPCPARGDPPADGMKEPRRMPLGPDQRHAARQH